jgi:hypothetical protein
MLKRFWHRIRRPNTPNELATRELARAELQHLEALAELDYARALVAYHETRITRLRGYLTKAPTPAYPSFPPSRPSALYNLAREET